MNAKGGGNDLSVRSLDGSASGLATIGVLLAGLGIFAAVPHPVAAQGTCAGTGGTPPKLTLSSDSTTTKIACSGLDQGLELDLNGAQIDTSSTPHRTLSVNARGDGDKDVKVMGDITIDSGGVGIHMVRDGAGLLELNLGKDSTITSSGDSADEYKAIFLRHRGSADTKATGINIVSSANIDVSGADVEEKIGIWAEVAKAPAGAIVPITIHLTGGSIYATSVSGKYQQGKGVVASQEATGDIMITVEPGVNIGAADKFLGTYGLEASVADTGTSSITIKHRGKIYATSGIIVSKEEPAKGRTDVGGDVLIETGADSEIVTRSLGTQTETYERADTNAHGIQVEIDGEAHTGDVKIIHRGMIEAAQQGIYASVHQDITVTLEKGSHITSKDRGIRVVSNGSGKVTITHGGTIDAAVHGISTTGKRAVTVTLRAGSRITAKKQGIIAHASATGIVTVKTEAGSSIVAAEHGIQVRHSGTDKRKFHVAVHGTVTGGATCTYTHTGRDKCAGVYVRNNAQDDDDPKLGGGTIVIGPWAHVKATSGVAIEVDGKAGDVAVILEQDEAGVVGHVEGQIFHPKDEDREMRDKAVEGEVTIKTRTASGAEKDLEVKDHVYRRGDRKGVYEQVFKAQLTELADKEGYRFVDDTTMDLRLYSHRARLYEVLPSMLLGLVELTPYSTRMAVPRRTTGDEEVMVQSSKGEHVAVPGSRTGVWVRLAVRDGERMADTSTTATDFWRQSLAWDVKQTDFEAGLEVPTDERLVLGVSAHYRQSEATVKNGGTMEASGTGVGVSLTWTDDSGLYVDGQLSYTRFFDVALTSSRQGVITSKGGGSGLALGVEVGQPMSIGGMAVTPRGGLSWSSVDLDAFGEPATIDGAGTVTPNKEQSVQGRVGVLAELGSGDADGRLYASLDLEHEFSSKHAVMAAGTRLATEVKPIWVRLGVGGAMSLGGRDTTMLTGDAFYATAGSDNTDFGGGLSMTFHF